MSAAPRASALALLAVLAVGSMLALFAGCGSDRIDPPPEGALAEDDQATESGIDSVATWARRAREDWASGKPALADAAGALARDAFAATWADLSQDKGHALEGERAERLPIRAAVAAPDPADVSAGLARIGLSAEIVVADGPSVLWQVIVRDPVGGSGALTEFWAWPDATSPLGPPVVQSLPADAPARARYGPEAVGALDTFGQVDGTGLASAWARPRGRAGLEVAFGKRAARGGAARKWKIETNRSLPIEADSVRFEPDPSGGAPVLVVTGSGARDPLFDDCPNCPRLERVQRYAYRGTSWSLASESVAPTPYAAFVAFLHAVSEGTPESALPWSDGPAVIDQAKELGLDHRPVQPLRAAPGTTAQDVTQRFRVGSDSAVEVTLEPRGQRWVVVDLRAARIEVE